MNNDILDGIKSGELILFLGAGASFGCKTSVGSAVPLGGALAKQMAEKAGFVYQDEPLDNVYEAARDKLQKRLDPFLESLFKHVSPSAEYQAIASYTWRRIYTLNIDDGLDTSLIRHSKQRVNKVSSRDPIIERNPFYETLEYVKLNGTIERIQDGLIFSPSEYAQATANHLPWYSQCASDFVRSPILFIGTQLNEPLLKYHIARYQTLNEETNGRAYLICPGATEIQIAGLNRYNIHYIDGTLEKFVSWLVDAIPVPPEPLAVAIANIPQLKDLFESANPRRMASLFEHVTVVKRDRLPGPAPSDETNTIKDFYKGFKPTWQDIVNGIPAELDVLEASVLRLQKLDNSKQLVPFLGPAGSGKTTLLMQICWRFSQLKDWDVFFIGAEPASLPATLDAIERSSKADQILIAIDNLEFSTEHVLAALKGGRLQKTLVIGAERESIWNRRGQHVLGEVSYPPTFIRDFSELDAKRILDRLKQYGSWTRLGKMSEPERMRELLDRAKKQLLIALLEATLGRGFEEIIEDEYAQISSDDERVFLTTVAIATDRRCDAPISLIDRALDKMSILKRSAGFQKDLAGIIHINGETLAARHPVYAKYLVEKVIDPTHTAKAINGLLQAFADYKSPVIQNVKKSEAILYKSLINHKFLFEVLKGNEERIVKIYSMLEKKFEADGLFWLQYGLALRDFSLHTLALEKLRIARDAYLMPHTEHALAQQLLLCAWQMSDRASAMGLAEEAKQILERLQDFLESDDTYPIITLAEGYTQVLKTHVGEKEARFFAKKYALLLDNMSKRAPQHDRLRASYEHLFKYASVGIWNDHWATT